MYHMLWYDHERRSERNQSRGGEKAKNKLQGNTKNKPRIKNDWWDECTAVPDKTLPDKPCGQSTISFPEAAHFGQLTEHSDESEAKLSIIFRVCDLIGQHKVFWCSQRMVLAKMQPRADATIILCLWTVLPSYLWDEVKSTAKKHCTQRKAHWGSFSRKK